MKHGNIEFFTVTCLNWQTLLKEDKHKQIILDSLAFLGTQTLPGQNIYKSRGRTKNKLYTFQSG